MLFISNLKKFAKIAGHEYSVSNTVLLVVQQAKMQKITTLI